MSENPVALCLAGHLSPEVALARLLLTGTPPEQIPAQLAPHEAPGNPAWHRLSALAARSDALASLAAMLREAEVDHDPVDPATGATPESAIAAIARIFDRAVARAPEASVAAYSLNDPAILAAATDEILAWLTRECLIAGDKDVLDLGCGIGRVAAALAPHCRSVLALDVSAGMIEEARRRHGHLPNLRFATTPGTGLAGHPAAGFDLILAVDSFPYLVQAGIAESHMRDAAHLLRPGGALAVLNLSYRGTPGADRADAARWAAEGGWHLAHDGTTPFTLWDGRAFLFRRPRSP
ncbi:class I SAM-dependent methyltransferase [Roseomonas populi]|uniref:Methyltransferase domain-containing protein n=1 Tax=Roseomonas populi TaxID=3121582 RepID=A0ABT1X5D5_9PROT|nr:class I SAM-dependent methyltransferase [Roseomonas pecuniae]MCR0983330.1 methyltransferase domain-containing protein [Roseomonas pecuniae]